jgi:3'-phosphoadenosine 5'-phosphosulfate sulfotransferase (PAPS reductase)/FAD synthetase
MTGQRILVWFSCGAASAVAADLTIKLYGSKNDVVVVNCDTRADEHPDNYRFCSDVERWLEQDITYIKSDKFTRVDDVFERTRYMAGVAGARCTTELKKLPRHAFARPDDYHVFGFTSDETKRINAFKLRNPELHLLWPLLDHNITKADSYRILQEANIELPTMYKLGFNNNNCIGCVKSTSPWYWQQIRAHFPEHFKSRASRSRSLNVRLIEYKGQRIFLDELPDQPYKYRGNAIENISCGPDCGNQPLDKSDPVS